MGQEKRQMGCMNIREMQHTRESREVNPLVGCTTIPWCLIDAAVPLPGCAVPLLAERRAKPSLKTT